MRTHSRAALLAAALAVAALGTTACGKIEMLKGQMALKDANADPKQDYNSLGGLGTWAAYTGMTEIMNKMTGPITAASFI